MKLRVVDQAKWSRAKAIAMGASAFVAWLCAIAFVGGLEGTEPIPHPFLAIASLVVAIILINQTKKEINR